MYLCGFFFYDVPNAMTSTRALNRNSKNGMGLYFIVRMTMISSLELLLIMKTMIVVLMMAVRSGGLGIYNEVDDDINKSYVKKKIKKKHDIDENCKNKKA